MAQLTIAAFQRDLANVRVKLETARTYIRFTRQQPQFGNFESTAKYAATVANETARVGASLQAFSNQLKQSYGIQIPDTISAQLQGAINAAVGSCAQITGGIQAARAYTNPEGVLYYTEQVAGTLDTVAGLQEQLGQLMGSIQPLVDAAEQLQREAQAQQQAAKQAEEQQRRAQQQAAKQAEEQKRR
ncbi:MAG: hypothetical protein ACRD72_24990, partial [Candidatus Angelobacter sp.]